MRNAEIIMQTKLSAFWAGVRTTAPLLLGVVPFALVYGVVVNGAGLPPGIGWAMSQIIFAGSSQLITARLFGEGTPILTIVLTAAIINLRHMLYSASIAPYVQHLSRKWRALLAYLLTDEGYAVGISHYVMHKAKPDPLSHWFFFGCGATMWLTWQIVTGIGIFIGGQIPASWGLDFAVPLTFIAIVFPALRHKADIMAAAVAGVVAVVAFAMPLKLGLIVATLLGIAAGVLVEAKFK